MIAAAVIGAAAGVLAGLLGTGGGVLFVPALTLFVGLGQVRAEATSLLAIVPVALVGAWRQRGAGQVRQGDAARLAALGAVGTVGGVALANVLPHRSLQIAFAVLMLAIASQLGRSSWRTRRARLSP